MVLRWTVPFSWAKGNRELISYGGLVLVEPLEERKITWKINDEEENLAKDEVKGYLQDVLRVSRIKDAVQVHLQHRVIM